MEVGARILKASRFLFCLTFKINDVLPARISETEGFAGQVKCAGAKYRRGRKPERCFAKAKPPKGGAAFIVC